MTIKFETVSATEHENGALLGSLSVSDYGAGTFEFYLGEVERFSFVGDKLYLGQDYHYDSETEKLVKYTSDIGSIRTFYPVDRVAVKFSEAATSNSTWDYISLNFTDVDENISLSPVDFSGYAYGATFAKITSSGFETLAYGLWSGISIFEISGDNLKLADNWYYDPQENHLVKENGYYHDLAKSWETLRINSLQTLANDINFSTKVDLTNAFSGVTNKAIPYFAGTPTITKEKSGVSTTDALLYDSPKAWANNKNYDNGTSTTITYSFSGTSDLYLFKDGYSIPNPKVDNIYAFSASQQDAVRLSLEQFSNVADITFVEVSETASEVGTLRFGNTDHNHSNGAALGWATQPFDGASGGDIWILSSIKDETFIRGQDTNFRVLMHEIGHALGLDHPFEGTDQLPTSKDFSNYTIMSYTDPANAYYNNHFLISSTPMVYDIAAIQHLYGAASHNSGDTTYKYDPAKPVAEAIWDSGGIDTLDFSSFSKGSIINLTAGSYSTIAFKSWSMTDNLGIAFGTTIEKAIGGSGNDTISGNSADNVLDGGRGNDTIYGGAGNDIFDQSGKRAGTDTFYGGEGDDVYFVYSSGPIDKIIEYSDQGIDTVELNSTSTYTLPENVENLTVFKNDSNKVLSGNSLNNVISAQGGNDTINGGDGDDIIYCGKGNDTLTGGLGSDEFRFYLGDGSNTITDFDVANDTCSFYTLSGNTIASENVAFSKNYSGEVEYSLADGTSVTLTGVFEAPITETFTVSTTVVTRSDVVMPNVTLLMVNGVDISVPTASSDGTFSVEFLEGTSPSSLALLSYSSEYESISSQDALDALKLSMGLSTSTGTKNAFDFLAADFNQDGKVSSQDALEILKCAIGLSTEQQAKWVFVDTNGDHSAINESNTSFTQKVDVSELSGDTSLSLTGILIGDVNDTYSNTIGMAIAASHEFL